MRRNREKPAQARLFILASTAAAAAIVWFAVVKGVGYSPGAGFLYSIGYFAALIIFFETFGYSLSGD